MFIPLKSVKEFQKLNPDCYDGQPIGQTPGPVLSRTQMGFPKASHMWASH